MSGDFSNSGHTVDCVGTPQLVAEEWVFDGSSSYLQVSDHSDFTFSGDFTIEVFGVKFASDIAVQAVVSHYSVTSPLTFDRSLLCYFDGSASPKKLKFIGSTDGSANTTISATFAPTVNSPYNLCWERSGSTVRLYAGAVGGDLTMLGSGTLSGALYNSAADLLVGAQDSVTPTNFLNGRIKALRITNGTARYATDTTYTPPSLPLPTS